MLGSELKCWLLHYSLPVLRDILPEPYWNNYVHLVASIHILSCEHIKSEDLDKSEQWLKKFYKDYTELYGT